MDSTEFTRYDFTTENDAAIKAGATWSVLCTLTDANGSPKDLTGYTGYMMIRNRPNGEKLTDVTVTITPAAGQILLSLTAAQTLAIRGAAGVYDLFLKSVTDTVCFLQGRAEVTANITDVP